MKIFKSAPKNGDIYSHEAPTAKVLIGLTWFFVLISAVTVTAAWNVYLQDALAPLGAWRVPAVILWGLCFVLPIEVMIFELSKYFWRSIIKGYWKGIHGGQFWTAAVLLLLGLVYSAFMSQKATKAAMIEAAPEVQVINTSELDRTYKQQVSGAASQYAENAEAVEARYDGMEKAVAQKYGAKIDGLQKDYEILDAKKNPANSKRLNGISRQILAAEKSKADELATLATAKNAELSEFQTAKLSAENSAAKIRQTNLSILEEKGAGSNAAKTKFTKVFSGLISGVAAMAVLFVFLLARFIELFYHRTGMSRVVVVENSDINGAVILDVIRFPFAYVSRNLADWISKKYAALPKPVPPPAPDAIYNTAGMSAPIVSTISEPAKGMTRRTDDPPHVIPIAYSGPPIYTPLADTETTAAKAEEQPAKPLPPEPAKSVAPFSLKESKPLKDVAKSETAKGFPDELEDIIKAAFKNPVTDPANFYDRMEVWPSGYATAFDYLEKLKKTARNCYMAANNSKGKDGTRQANAVRLAYLEAELCRMSVGVIRIDGGLKFRWILSQSERDGWRAKVPK